MSDPRSPRELPEQGAPSRSRSAGQRGGPYLLFVPLAFTVAAVWWTRNPGESLVPRRPPERVDPETTHDVLGGEARLDGATLVCWLSPSELDPARQTFRTKALRKRYDLAEGEPWRLRLEWHAREGTSSSANDSTINLSQLTIEDPQGRALAPLHLERELDPLATLLQPPAQELRIGTSIDLVLWGRAPLAGARLAGSESHRGGTGQDLLLPLDVGLSLRPLRIGDLAGPMARLDPPAGASNSKSEGKTPGSGASALPVRGADGARY